MRDEAFWRFLRFSLVCALMITLFCVFLHKQAYAQNLTPEQEAGLSRLYYQVNQSWRFAVYERPVESTPQSSVSQVVNHNVIVNVTQPESRGYDRSYDPWTTGYVVWPSSYGKSYQGHKGRIIPCSQRRR